MPPDLNALEQLDEPIIDEVATTTDLPESASANGVTASCSLLTSIVVPDLDVLGQLDEPIMDEAATAADLSVLASPNGATCGTNDESALGKANMLLPNHLGLPLIDVTNDLAMLDHTQEVPPASSPQHQCKHISVNGNSPPTYGLPTPPASLTASAEVSQQRPKPRPANLRALAERDVIKEKALADQTAAVAASPLLHTSNPEPRRPA